MLFPWYLISSVFLLKREPWQTPSSRRIVGRFFPAPTLQGEISALAADRDALRREVVFYLRDLEGAEVEEARGQDGAGVTLVEDVGEMLQRAGAAATT